MGVMYILLNKLTDGYFIEEVSVLCLNHIHQRKVEVEVGEKTKMKLQNTQ